MLQGLQSCKNRLPNGGLWHCSGGKFFADIDANKPLADRWLGLRLKTGAAGVDVSRGADGGGGRALRIHRRAGDAELNTFRSLFGAFGAA